MLKLYFIIWAVVSAGVAIPKVIVTMSRDTAVSHLSAGRKAFEVQCAAFKHADHQRCRVKELTRNKVTFRIGAKDRLIYK